MMENEQVYQVFWYTLLIFMFIFMVIAVYVSSNPNSRPKIALSVHYFTYYIEKQSGYF